MDIEYEPEVEPDTGSSLEHSRDSEKNIASKIVLSGNSCKKFLLVEVPALIQNEKKAFELLGSQEIVEKQLNNQLELNFRFPGENPLRSTLISNKVNKSGLLVKIRRKKSNPEAPLVQEVLGVVTIGKSFETPADYQFLPSSVSINDYKTPPLNQKVLEVVPQSFSRIEDPNRPKFLAFLHGAKNQELFTNKFTRTKKSIGQMSQEIKGNDEEMDISKDNQDDSDTYEPEDEEQDDDIDDDEDIDKDDNKRYTGLTKRGNKIRSNRIYAVIIDFNDPAPLGHPQGHSPPQWKNYAPTYLGFQLIEKIREILNVIPVISKTHMIEILDVDPKSNVFFDSLRFASYTYINGPFRGSWIKFGYNPTKDPKSVIYQQMGMKFPFELLFQMSKKISDKFGIGKSAKKMFDIDTLSLVDIPDHANLRFVDKGSKARLPISYKNHAIRNFIRSEISEYYSEEFLSLMKTFVKLDQCHENTGWITSRSLEDFRKCFTYHLNCRIDSIMESESLNISNVSNSTKDLSSGELSEVDFSFASLTFEEKIKYLQEERSALPIEDRQYSHIHYSYISKLKSFEALCESLPVISYEESAKSIIPDPSIKSIPKLTPKPFKEPAVKPNKSSTPSSSKKGSNFPSSQSKPSPVTPKAPIPKVQQEITTKINQVMLTNLFSVDSFEIFNQDDDSEYSSDD